MIFLGPDIEIMRKRERLLMRCDAQRLALADAVDQLHGPLKIADRAVEVVAYMRAHPLLSAAAVALLVVTKRRGWLGWVRRGFILWRTYRAFGGSVAA